MDVRVAREADRERILAISAQIWDGYDYVPHVLDEWLAGAQGELLVAEIDGHVAAFSYLTWLADGHAWLQGIRADTAMRGRGAAKALTERSIARAWAAGARRIGLSTYIDNQASMHIAESFGFRRVASFVYLEGEPAGRDEMEDVDVEPLSAEGRGRHRRQVRLPRRGGRALPVGVEVPRVRVVAGDGARLGALSHRPSPPRPRGRRAVRVAGRRSLRCRVPVVPRRHPRGPRDPLPSRACRAWLGEVGGDDSQGRRSRRRGASCLARGRTALVVGVRRGRVRLRTRPGDRDEGDGVTPNGACRSDRKSADATRDSLRFPISARRGQERLKAARVLVVGVGGLGSPASLYLAAAGIGTLGIVDPDAVEISNLQRQILYGERDAGRPKVEAARQRLADLNSHVRIEAHPTRFAGAEARKIAAEYDVIVDGTDNLESRYVMNDVALDLGIPYAYGAVFQLEGRPRCSASPEGPATAVSSRLHRRPRRSGPRRRPASSEWCPASSVFSRPPRSCGGSPATRSPPSVDSRSTTPGESSSRRSPSTPIRLAAPAGADRTESARPERPALMASSSLDDRPPDDTMPAADPISVG